MNGYTYRSTTGVMGGRTLVPLAKEHRDAAGVAAGDDVVVEPGGRRGAAHRRACRRTC
nr:DUF1905 domain-containing protein [Angustibacter aerolatus]